MQIQTCCRVRVLTAKEDDVSTQFEHLQNSHGRYMLPRPSGNERFDLASMRPLFTLNVCSYKCLLSWYAQIYLVIPRSVCTYTNEKLCVSKFTGESTPAKETTIINLNSRKRKCYSYTDMMFFFLFFFSFVGWSESARFYGFSYLQHNDFEAYWVIFGKANHLRLWDMIQMF